MMKHAPQAKDQLTDFRADAESAVPPFMQLHGTVVTAIAHGRILPGQRLPTIRALASQVGLATNTVAAAYRALEQSGVIEGRGRAGTFVRLGDDPVDAEARRIALETVTAMRGLGIAKDRALRLLSDAYNVGARP